LDLPKEALLTEWGIAKNLPSIFLGKLGFAAVAVALSRHGRRLARIEPQKFHVRFAEVCNFIIKSNSVSCSLHRFGKSKRQTGKRSDE
jgi:hypothetical protein